MAESRTLHVFGPVPSRRLGRSLGVDLVPFKVCSFDCLYCQLGRTTNKTLERREYVSADEVIEDVRSALDRGARPDYVTLSGSGEPTLYLHLDEVIVRIRKLTDTPIALLTNGSLLYREDVRRDAALADVVLPSLDAPNAELFERINRPAPGIGFGRYVDGLVKFREEYDGPIWLEIFLLRGINDRDEHVAGFRRHIERIRPDKIHLNTAVRPTADAGALQVEPEHLERLCRLFGPKASVVADVEHVHARAEFVATREQVLGMLGRRPCTADDVAGGLGIHPNEVMKHVEHLLDAGEIVAERRGDKVYYRRPS
jgi:wyosine [tRNA(Phe)-imidazoG37] synthetase (radical SAM superfamily)